MIWHKGNSPKILDQYKSLRGKKLHFFHLRILATSQKRSNLMLQMTSYSMYFVIFREVLIITHPTLIIAVTIWHIKSFHLCDPIADTTSLSLWLASSALCNLLMLLAVRGGLRNPLPYPLEYWYDDGGLWGEAIGGELPLASRLNLDARTLRFLEDPLSKSGHMGPLWLRCGCAYGRGAWAWGWVVVGGGRCSDWSWEAVSLELGILGQPSEL